MVTLGGLTRRELATLWLVERRLTNAEIAEEFGISVRTVESHIAALRRKLNAESRAELIRLAREMRGAAVPVPQTSFVGRGRQLADVRALLERARWVTVAGPAGSGKTRLALEVAIADDRAAVVVELEHATPADVPSVVAKAVGVGVAARQDPVEAIGVALGLQPHLLLLDNADRVGMAARTLVRQLMVAAPELAILATSRAPLGDGAESVYALQPLDTQGPDAPAGRLFIDRVQSAVPGLLLTTDDLASVGRICHRLDGLPLAIELAAARVRHLTVPELEAQLSDGFGALERGGGGRHDTLEAAFAWTWSLLDDDERAVLSRLAALPRTFDLDLAEAITTHGTSRIVLRLLDRSLVVPALRATLDPPERSVQHRSHTPVLPRRFRILEVLRHFTLARTPPAVIEQVRDAHLQHHATRASVLAARARVDDSTTANEMASQLCPETSAALAWAITRQSDVALSLACAIAVGVEQYGPDLASIDALAQAARNEKVRAMATAADLSGLGQALCYHDLDLVAELAELALERADSAAAELAAQYLAGLCAAYRDQNAEALAHLAVAERVATQLADHWYLGSVHMATGIAKSSNDPAGAMDSIQVAIEEYAQAGDAMHVNNARYMMARFAARAGCPPEDFIAWAQECVDYASEKGNAHELGHALLARAPAMYPPHSEHDLAAAIDIFRSVGDLRCLSRSYLSLAGMRDGDQRLAHLGDALHVAERLHDRQLEAQARAGLITALWEDGDRRRSAVEFGIVVGRGVDDVARTLLPEHITNEITAWSAALAEGQARANSQQHHHSQTGTVHP